jgi:hypothetical protein
MSGKSIAAIGTNFRIRLGRGRRRISSALSYALAAVATLATLGSPARVASAQVASPRSDYQVIAGYNAPESSGCLDRVAYVRHFIAILMLWLTAHQ